MTENQTDLKFATGSVLKLRAALTNSQTVAQAVGKILFRNNGQVPQRA